MFQSRSLEALIEELRKLPGIGRKSAARIAFHVLRAPQGEAEALARRILEIKEKVRSCRVCGNWTEDETCSICLDPRRDGAIICVVEQPGDVALVEGTGSYRGLYHVLHGALSPLEGVRPEELRIRELAERAAGGSVREIIVATNPTVEGDATAFYIQNAVRETGVLVSRIARGVPVGGEIEFADQVTLARALEGRRALE
ncbi:MAG: recombination protein RecR [Candidatus Latescibacterota bacterium]|nr:MAG: recombination protein RecR [Candidatus Latescibacterota bacterium]